MNINDDFIENNNCIICSSKNLRFIGEKSKAQNISKITCQIFECLNCNHWFTDPMPKQQLLDRLYSENSEYVISENWVQNTKNNNNPNISAPDTHWIVSYLSKYSPGNYLEIGPGSGVLFRKMRELGWNCFAIDLGSYAEGSNVFSSPEHLPPNILYDVIVFQDVLEHVSNPNASLLIYSKYLIPGSLLFMTVPWSESKSAQNQKTNWDMVDPLGHLHYFSKSSAETFLSAAGFEIIQRRTINIYFQSYFKCLALEFFHMITRVLRPWKWHKLNGTIESLKFFLQFFPGDPDGDQLYVIAKKRDLQQ